MDSQPNLPNCVRSMRLARGWSQAELAERAGISRTAVSAIEGQRLVPSVAAALALARVFQCGVEEVFGSPRGQATGTRWAWAPHQPASRYWQAEVDGRFLLYPIEPAAATFSVPHDGRVDPSRQPPDISPLARQTLVVACCDPAAGLLAAICAQATGFRMIAIPRSSQQALDLLAQGLVHAAGLHLSTAGEDRNALAVRTKLGAGYKLMGVAIWQEGLAIGAGKATRSARSVLHSRLRWVGREAGSGARQCMDELLPEGTVVRRIARDHRGVAEAIRSGWADAGVCLRLACDEAGLSYLNIRDETFELCFSSRTESDPRIQALVRVVRSPQYRRVLTELPGYDPSIAGDIRCVD